VQVHRQFFRGERWYVLRDPFSNSFYRLRPAAYDFVARLRPDRTLEQVWQLCLERDPEGARGQEDVIQLLAQLYFANLLQYEMPADSVKLFERYRKRRQREVRSQLLNIMFARFPLWDPDEFLQRAMPAVGWLFGPLGALLWLVAVGAALKVVVDQFGVLVDQSQGILAPRNLFLLYAALVLTKALHEMGHAFMCRRFGGEVHAMGIMLLIFTPIPYMDATSSWAFRSRWRRVLVGAAGMITEILVAAVAALVWARTGPGTVHSLAYNMMFIASVSTVLFNANPLLRFDGYYILSDLLDIPNLHAQAAGHLKHLVERYAFGYRQSESPAGNTKEACWLTFFGLASGAYRIVVFTGIILFVADRFLIAGLVMALVCAVSWGVVPAGRFVHYLFSSPKLERSRPRAIAVASGTAVLLLALLWWIPFPDAFKAPGVLEAVSYAEVATESPGYMREMVAVDGALVQADTPLVRLADPELKYELELARAQWAEGEAKRRRALQQVSADVAPIRAYLEAVKRRWDRLEERRDALTVRAPLEGLWVAPHLVEQTGAWLPRGAVIGRVIDPRQFRFSAIVPQQEASRLFEGQARSAEVRLRGQPGEPLRVTRQTLIPAEQETLPSAALGWQGGGDVAVALTDPTGRQAAEPFFQLLAEVESRGDTALLHGRSGRIRFRLPPRPLLRQWGRRLRQMLQRRYRL
jgi:putative peptide zinc metalloprotease protein